MNKKELIKILLTKTNDREMDHMNADNALLAYIDDKEISKAFQKVEKWYS